MRPRNRETLGLFWNPRKVYPVDPGRIPIFDRAGRPDEGQALTPDLSANA
jgi:hypothetical protein